MNVKPDGVGVVLPVRQHVTYCSQHQAIEQYGENSDEKGKSSNHCHLQFSQIGLWMNLRGKDESSLNGPDGLAGRFCAGLAHSCAVSGQCARIRRPAAWIGILDGAGLAA